MVTAQFSGNKYRIMHTALLSQHHFWRIQGCLLPNAALWGFAICCGYCSSLKLSFRSTAHSNRHRHIKKPFPRKTQIHIQALKQQGQPLLVQVGLLDPGNVEFLSFLWYLQPWKKLWNMNNNLEITSV